MIDTSINNALDRGEQNYLLTALQATWHAPEHLADQIKSTKISF